MVVDFTVDGEDDGPILRFEGLRSGVYFSKKGVRQFAFDGSSGLKCW